MITPKIKFWLESILDKSRELLKLVIGKKGVISSDRTRAFVLKSLIKAAGIKAVRVNEEKFIAEILNTDSDTIGEYFNNFEKPYFGMKEGSKRFYDQIVEAENISELLLNETKLKENDNEILKGNKIVNNMKKIISSAKKNEDEK